MDTVVEICQIFCVIERFFIHFRVSIKLLDSFYFRLTTRMENSHDTIYGSLKAQRLILFLRDLNCEK